MDEILSVNSVGQIIIKINVIFNYSRVLLL